MNYLNYLTKGKKLATYSKKFKREAHIVIPCFDFLYSENQKKMEKETDIISIHENN